MLIPEALYSKILEVMPIPCVDLMVGDPNGRLLLMQRRNEPAAGKWWFPGGRVLLGELRIAAAARKLEEECGLKPERIDQAGTFDILFDIDGRCVHGITTIFRVKVRCTLGLKLDSQSEAADWLTPQQWLKRDLHPFIRSRLEDVDHT